MASGAAGRGAPIEIPEGAQPAQSDQEKADAQAQAAVEAAAAKQPEASDERFVRYLGPQNIVKNAEALQTRAPRLGEGTYADMSPQDWSSVGISAKSPETLVWNVFNNYRVPASKFSQDQIDYLLSNSKRFELVDREGNKVKS